VLPNDPGNQFQAFLYRIPCNPPTQSDAHYSFVILHSSFVIALRPVLCALLLVPISPCPRVWCSRDEISQSNSMPCALRPVPIALRPVPFALCSVPCALCPVLCALRPVLCALCPSPFALCPVPCALRPVPLSFIKQPLPHFSPTYFFAIHKNSGTVNFAGKPDCCYKRY